MLHDPVDGSSLRSDVISQFLLRECLLIVYLLIIITMEFDWQLMNVRGQSKVSTVSYSDNKVNED